MPRLDARLIAVTKQIRSESHVDIGSDHGKLLVSLLKSGRVKRGIAIENKRQPFENSVRALQSVNAEIRFGDGLEVFQAGDAESLSICGMGPENMCAILAAFPQRVPDRVVLQPNGKPEIVRRWALNAGFHLIDEQSEQSLNGEQRFTILSYRRCSSQSELTEESADICDPAYRGVDHQAAILFGPLFLKRKEPWVLVQLREEEAYWNQFGRLKLHRAQRLAVIRKVLNQNDVRSYQLEGTDSENNRRSESW